MTTLFEDANDAVGLHALVISVGAYGTDAGADARSLTAAPASAVAVARWLLDGYESPDAPLRSLELLVSPPDGTTHRFEDGRRGIALDVERAVRGFAQSPAPGVPPLGVEAAVDRWFGRANGSESNVTLFFFCGHGVEHMGDPHALLDGFTPATPDAFARASIHVPRFVKGMELCAARRQLFLVDACRDTPSWTLSKQQSLGHAFVDFDLDLVPAGRAPRKVALMYAAQSGQRAGASGTSELSRFTDAFLAVVEGPACRVERTTPRRWRVATLDVIDSIQTLLDEGLLPSWGDQTPHLGDGANFLFHRPANPTVPLLVRGAGDRSPLVGATPMTRLDGNTFRAQVPPGKVMIVAGAEPVECFVEPSYTEVTL